MHDVAIVGFGPVGQAAAILLGQAGHDVLVVERFPESYRLPRAVHFDAEVMRLLQGLGVAEEVEREAFPATDYVWYGADGDELMTLRAPTPAESGWEPDYLFFQPDLEGPLQERATALGTVTVRRGVTAAGVEQDADGVTLRLDDGEEVRARWLLGADGANSLVRETLGLAQADFGFQERWLCVDVEPHDMDAIDLPTACQWCDPVRPTTHVRSGRRHRRWEFMLLPGEDPVAFASPESTWALLEPWFGPGDGALVRSTLYEFRSVHAETMRAGRALVIGDAAHLTPPFLGQGLGAGLRDAANVAWKLDLVLRGLADDTLLDTVTPERRAQNEQVIGFAIALGQVLCELDPEAAAGRDAAVRGSGAPPPPLEFARLDGGLIHRPTEGEDPLAGRLGVQGRVARGDLEGLLDDVTGAGLTLLVRDGDPHALLGPDRAAALQRAGARLVSLDPAQPAGVRDADGRLTAWLDEHGAHAVLVRPDLYAFGSAARPGDVAALTDAFLQALSPTESEPAVPGSTVIRPAFHHVNLKTTRLQEMIDWYGATVGTQVTFQDEQGAWLTNDAANHRIALLSFPNFEDDPDRATRTGMHHSAFEYESFEALNASYVRMREAGIEPDFCLDHGMTLSYYYADPDGNHVELQVDNFGDWAASAEYMRTSETFQANPIGSFVDPAKVADAAAAGASAAEIHERAMAGELAPEQAPVELPS